jgi:hypothetical protein
LFFFFLLLQQGNKFIEVIRQQKMKDLAIAKTQKELLMKDKLRRIAKDQRIKEYKRERALKRMENAEEKLAETMRRKQKLIDDRKKAAIEMAHRKFQMQRSMNMIRASGKWDLMDCLADDGTISKKQRRKQLREMKRRKREGGDDDAGSNGGSPRI